MGQQGFAYRLIPVLLLAAAGLVTWALWEGDDDPGASFEEGLSPADAGRSGLPRGPTKAKEAVSSKEASPARTLPRNAHGIPRISTPDSVIEDVRDALALPAGTRQDALASAVGSVARLAEKGGALMQGLRRYLETVDDPTVRGAALSALGADRMPSNLGWLAGQLGHATSSEARLGALLALARSEKGRRASARSLGGLSYSFDTLPDRDDVLVGLTRFMELAAPGNVSLDALPIVLHTVRTSGVSAALLVGKDGRTRAWLDTLTSAQRNEVLDAALRHRDLPDYLRKVLEAVRTR